ncbi:MAG: SHD1 domain-containing protein [Planctomycetota bacterium]
MPNPIAKIWLPLNRIPALFLCAAFLLGPLCAKSHAEDLIQAPEEIVRFKLSNLRVKTGITSDGISFDYRRVGEGSGQARIVVRTNEGKSQILGMPIQIKESGTIRLRDLFGRTRSILDPDADDGIAFYFVVDYPGYGSRKQYLVSNVLRNGSFHSKVKARPLSQEELDQIERERIAKLPPKDVPAGYVRCTTTTSLVPGAPVMYGSVGQWKSGVVVDFPSPSFLRVKASDSDQLRTVRRQDWVAVSEKTLQQINSNPSQFSISIRTLPGGSIVLADDVQPLQAPMKLAKGTPLLREKYGKWQNVWFLSSDNVSVRALTRESRGPKVEFIPIKELAIRQQSLADQSNEQAKESFAANVAGYENQVNSLANSGGSMASAGSFGSGSLASGSPDVTPTAPPPTRESLSVGPLRKWSDQTGKFEIEAQLVEQDGDNVLLKRADQRTISVPVAKLSEADQRYLKGLSEESPFDNVVDGMSSTGNTSSSASGSPVDYSRLMQPVRTIGDLSWGAKSVAISPENRFLLIGRKASSASLIDLSTGQMIVDSGRMEHMGDIGVCGFTRDGRYMILGGGKGVFELYEPDEKGRLQLKGQHALHNKEITALALSGDSKFALSGDTDKTVRYWNLESGEPIATIDGFDGKIKATCISPSGDQLMATDGKTLKAYSVKQGKVIASMQVGRSHASGQAAAFSPDGSKVAVGDGYKIEVWDLANNRKLGVLEGKEINWSMCFAPDNRHLLSGGNGTIYVWDCQTMTKLQTNRIGQSFYVQALATSPDGTFVSSPSDHSSVVVLQAGQ